jgi:two-component system LytT family response regulator
MKCLIIDDDPFQRHVLSQYIDQVESLELVAECDSADEAVKFLQQNNIDLLFLDIEMPGMSGLEFIEAYKPKGEVIFISSKEHYAINGYNLEVADYLLKPITFARFNRAVSKVGKKSNALPVVDELTNFLFIKDKGVYQKVLIADIQYIQSSSEYVTIYTKNKRTMLYSSMDGMLKKLPANFIRVHRSYIVNLNAIDKVNGNTVEVNNQSISVSKTYHNDLMNHLGLKVKQKISSTEEVDIAV